MHFRRALVTAALLLACSPKPADTDGDAGSSTAVTEGAEATSATNTAPTTSAGTTSDEATTTGPSTPPASVPTSAEDTASITSSSASGEAGTGDETGGPTGGLPTACMTVCMHWDTCEPGSAGPVDECTANCLAGVEVPSPCAMASAALADCIAELPCAEALKFIKDGEPPTACGEEQKTAEAICEGPPGCGGEITGGGDFCELEQDCDGLKQNIACDLDSGLCTCTENDVPIADCPEAGFCALDREAQTAVIASCCGWKWM